MRALHWLAVGLVPASLAWTVLPPATPPLPLRRGPAGVRGLVKVRGGEGLDLDSMLLSGMEENAKKETWAEDRRPFRNSGGGGRRERRDGGGREGSYGGGGGGGGGRRERGRGGDGRLQEGEAWAGQFRAQSEFGPAGHDYERDPRSTGQLTVPQEQIDQLLARRLQAKFRRDFRTADDLQEELWAAGVEVHEGRRMWAVHEIAVANKGPGAYVCGSPDEFLTGLDVSQVDSYIQQRIQARRGRNYALADTLRKDLADLGVLLNDKKRLWYVNGPFGHPYSATEDGFESYVDVAKVHKLLRDRYDAKIAKQYDVADDHHDHLRRLGVGVDDKNFLWFVYHEDRDRLLAERRGAAAAAAGVEDALAGFTELEDDDTSTA